MSPAVAPEAPVALPSQAVERALAAQPTALDPLVLVGPRPVLAPEPGGPAVAPWSGPAVAAARVPAAAASPQRPLALAPCPAHWALEPGAGWPAMHGPHDEATALLAAWAGWRRSGHGATRVP